MLSYNCNKFLIFINRLRNLVQNKNVCIQRGDDKIYDCCETENLNHDLIICCVLCMGKGATSHLKSRKRVLWRKQNEKAFQQLSPAILASPYPRKFNELTHAYIVLLSTWRDVTLRATWRHTKRDKTSNYTWHDVTLHVTRRHETFKSQYDRDCCRGVAPQQSR